MGAYPPPGTQDGEVNVVNIGPGERYDLLMSADNPGTCLFDWHTC